MIVTLLAMSIALQEADRPTAPDADALSRQTEGLRHADTDERPNADVRTMQEQAREEREDNADRQTQTSDNEVDEPRQRRRQDGQGLRPARRPNPGG